MWNKLREDLWRWNFVKIWKPSTAALFRQLPLRMELCIQTPSVKKSCCDYSNWYVLAIIPIVKFENMMEM